MEFTCLLDMEFFSQGKMYFFWITFTTFDHFFMNLLSFTIPVLYMTFKFWLPTYCVRWVGKWVGILGGLESTDIIFVHISSLISGQLFDLLFFHFVSEEFFLQKPHHHE